MKRARAATSSTDAKTGTTRPPLRSAPFWSLAALFALSGAGALVIETVWVRWLRDWMGATASATAAATTAFFAGSSLGAWLGARRARRVVTPREALRDYARVEVLAAAGACAMPLLLEGASLLLSASYAALAERGALLVTLRFATALAVTLPAAAAYGATFPLIGAAALPSPTALGSRGTGLYAMSCFGAVLGVVVATWWAPPAIGVNGTYALGIAAALVAGAGAWRLATKDSGPLAETMLERAGVRRPLSASVVGLAALSGFVALVAQVLLVHAFALVVNQSVHAFGAVLIAVLLCLALGASFVATLRARDLASPRGIASGALAASTFLFLLTPTWIQRATGGLDTVRADAFGLPYGAAVVATVLLAAGPALFAAACLWPAALALAGEIDRATPGAAPSGGTSEAGFRIGMAAAVNTAGAIVAGIATPFVLIPWLGTWGGFVVVAGLCGVGAVLIRPPAGVPRWAPAAAVVSFGALVAWIANPLTLPQTRSVPGVRLLFESSSPGGVVSVLERDGERLVRLDNHYALGGTSEWMHEERQGHLPLLLHGRPKRVAFTGTATGITAGAALAHSVDEITLIEIVPEVVAAARAYFGEANRGVYDDPRSHVVIDDARNYWRHTADRFDVIVADLFVPWHAGTGSLYTREHFAAMRDRLRPGGLVAQWLPLYQLSADELAILLATFTDVFPTAALFRGDFYGAYPIVALVGWRDEPAPSADVEAAAKRLAAAGVADRWVTDPVALWSLYVAPLAPDASGDVPRNVLAWPRLEYLAAARHAGGARGKVDPVIGLDWIERVKEWQAVDSPSDRLFPVLSEAALRARRGGSALQRAGALFAARREQEAAAALATAGDLLPRRVLAHAPPDPSAADLWFDAPSSRSRP